MTMQKQVFGGGGAVERLVHATRIKEQHDSERRSTYSKDDPRLDGNFKSGKEACSKSSVHLG